MRRAAFDGDDMTANDTDDGTGHLAAAALIARFGGVRPMASRLGVPVSTVQGWKQRDAIPLARREQIRAAAAEHGIALDEAMLAPVIDVATGAMVDAIDTPRAASVPSPRRPMIAAVVLGILALAVGSVALAGVLQPDLLGIKRAAPRAPSLAPLERRIAALEARPEATDAKTLAERVEALTAQLDTISAMAAEARRMAGTATGDPAMLAALGQKLAALELALTAEAAERRDLAQRLLVALRMFEGTAPAEDVTALEARIAAMEPIRAAIADIDRRIVALEGAEKMRGEARGDAAALALAAAGLRRAVAAGEPFADTLALARKFAGDDAATLTALDRLDAVAAKGVPEERTLRTSFEVAARTARDALRNEGRTSWSDRALARLEGVVTIRRTEPRGDGPEAALTRAEQRLAAGDLAGANEALAGLDGVAAGAVAAWRERAGVRLDALAAGAALEARALERLAAGS